MDNVCILHISVHILHISACVPFTCSIIEFGVLDTWCMQHLSIIFVKDSVYIIISVVSILNFAYTSDTRNYNCQYWYLSVFDKLIWCITDPESFSIGTTQFSLWSDGTINIITNSINCLLIGSRCIPNGTHAN